LEASSSSSSTLSWLITCTSSRRGKEQIRLKRRGAIQISETTQRDLKNGEKLSKEIKAQKARTPHLQPHNVRKCPNPTGLFDNCIEEGRFVIDEQRVGMICRRVARIWESVSPGLEVTRIEGEFTEKVFSGAYNPRLRDEATSL
jgi:hypothetical protein